MCFPRFLTTLHQYIMGDNGSSAEGGSSGKCGLAKLFIDGEQVGEGRVDKTQPAVFSADETADVGQDDATPVANKVFKDTKFTGYVNEVTISIPEK